MEAAGSDGRTAKGRARRRPARAHRCPEVRACGRGRDPDDATVALPRATPPPATPDDATVALPRVTPPPARPAAVVPPTQVSRPKAAPAKVGPGRPAPTVRPPAGASPVAAPPRPAPPVAGPAKIPAPEPASTGKKRWPILVTVGVVLAAAAGGAYLLTSTVSSNSAEDQVKTAINTFVDAIEGGDLATLRTISCGDLASYYAQIPDAEFADVYRVAVDQRSIPVVESIDTVSITDDTAIAQATVHTGAAPNESSARSFNLQRDGDAWKVC
ncbi:hypothetical protein BTZ20_0911 [Rhodococcus sp. MTM3W5.2]|uniref:Rv0361 family membrane protein n=1 Tax=Rhodococcus sp. MTM3W5.2 TaxID=1805827 RepID=UPI0009793762|nr:hypothetical protein [Rhodococcus sp. MTM3W5.2]AQA24005.1 hypothetical protein BTZ20_0911 [Rhodococcus sp. MTM3W5.2]